MTRRHRPLTLVAAVAANGVIGDAGAMPWRLPGDLARFRRLTMGHPLLMGRRTHEAIGRPLPGRPTVVLSRRSGLSLPGVTVAADLDAALAIADRQADLMGAATVMVVGGAAVYGATISMAERLLITEIMARPRGDARFPPIDPALWRRRVEEEPARNPDDDHATCFVRWERR